MFRTTVLAIASFAFVESDAMAAPISVDAFGDPNEALVYRSFASGGAELLGFVGNQDLIGLSLLNVTPSVKDDGTTAVATQGSTSVNLTASPSST